MFYENYKKFAKGPHKCNENDYLLKINILIS